nr:unnamed protein product [Digitaria exilis]
MWDGGSKSNQLRARFQQEDAEAAYQVVVWVVVLCLGLRLVVVVRSPSRWRQVLRLVLLLQQGLVVVVVVLLVEEPEVVAGGGGLVKLLLHEGPRQALLDPEHALTAVPQVLPPARIPGMGP